VALGFFVNLPFGILTVLALRLHEREPGPPRRAVLVFGFLSLSLGIGALQMMLDRGQDLAGSAPARSSPKRSSRSSASISSRRSTTSKRPFVAVRIFRDWNFSVALVFMFIIGIILLATMALVTPFIQNLLATRCWRAAICSARAASARSSR